MNWMMNRLAIAVGYLLLIALASAAVFATPATNTTVIVCIILLQALGPLVGACHLAVLNVRNGRSKAS